MLKRILLIFIGLFIITGLSFSQTDKVRSCMKQVASGKIQEVKMQMADLLAEYPDDAGVQLLHGIVLDDAFKAVDIYEKIIKKHPDSEWADHAYWRLVQFYAIVGNVERASEELEKYRKSFPTSEFLITASDAVRYAQLAAKSDLKSLKSSKTKKQAVSEVPEPTTVKKEIEKPQKKTKEIKEQPQKEQKQENNDEPEEVKSNWGLQVGVYSTEDVARQEMERYQQMRLRTVVINKKVDGAIMYAVVIGNYSTKESAEQAKAIVQNQCGCSPIIIKK
jgi:cell division septation protein DedD